MVMQIVQNLFANYLTKKVVTDNVVFRLHYQFTVSLLVVFGVLATSYQFFANPIECSISQKNFQPQFVNAFCYIHPTFIVPDPDGKRSPAESEMRSVGLQNSEGKSEFKQHNNYYQWVSFVLFIQALLIYLPRYLWKGHENRINRSLRLDAELDLLDSTKIERVRNYIIGYLLKKPKICHNSSYYLHVLCEVANLLMVLGQFILMNAFLNANFTSYGLKVLQYGNWSNEQFFDPMTRAFPKLVKCLFQSYGSSGSVQKSDYLCLLPYNLVNERTYLFLWFWFQLLILLSVINLIYRLLAACSHEVRCAMIMSKTECAVDRTALSSIVYNVSVGEWYILEILAENLDSELFDGIVTGIYEILAQKKEFSNRSD